MQLLLMLQYASHQSLSDVMHDLQYRQTVRRHACTYDSYCTQINVDFLRAKAATVFSASWPSQFCLSVRLSVRLFVCHTGGSVKNGASYHQIFISLSAAWKTLVSVSGTIKLFHKFEGVTPNEGAK